MEKNCATTDLNEEEICVDCGIKLGYLKRTPIEFRPFYTEGAGDRCSTCTRISDLKEQIEKQTIELKRLERLQAKPK